MSGEHTEFNATLEAAVEETLETIQAQRAELRDTLAGLQGALATPAAERGFEWAQRARDALRGVREAFSDDAEITEAPGGLFQEVLARAPRLGGKVRSLRGQQGKVSCSIDQETEVLSRLQPNDPEERITEVSRSLLSLVSALMLYRQNEADLIYDAYHVDIGGEGA